MKARVSLRYFVNDCRSRHKYTKCKMCPQYNDGYMY